MDAFGLTTPQFSILMLVFDNGDVNQKQLGQALDISPPNMAVTLDRMAERGWIERVRSTRDRRAQQIHLTAGRPGARRAHAPDRGDHGRAGAGGAVARRAGAADRAAAQDRAGRGAGLIASLGRRLARTPRQT